jgi:DNA-binding transcriptional LysR family regulator
MNIRNFDLNLLRVFAAVERERSVSRAAVLVGLSQPAMSNALSRLRHACGDPLFVRTPAGMEPTALAIEMAVPVNDALDRLEQALGGAAAFRPDRLSRGFRLLMSDAGQRVVLPLLMNALAETAPEAVIEVVQLPREQYAEALQIGLADLAVGHLSTLRAGIHQQPLFSDSYVCIAAEAHPVLRGSLSLQQFVSARHVAIAAGSAEAQLERVLAGKRMKRKVALTVAQYHAAIDVVRSTALLATLPRRSVGTGQGIQVLDLPFGLSEARIRQFWHRRQHNDAANAWLRELLRSLTAGQT